MRADPLVVQRWNQLRGMLIDQLEMFESGRLTLKAGGEDVSADAVIRLKRDILEFDRLLREDADRA